MWSLAIPAAMAVLGARNAQRKNDQLKAQNQAQAEQTRYSAWSGLGGGQINNNYEDPLNSALQGGLQGAAFAQGMGQGQPQPQPQPDAMMAGQNQMPAFGKDPNQHWSAWQNMA